MNTLSLLSLSTAKKAQRPQTNLTYLWKQHKYLTWKYKRKKRNLIQQGIKNVMLLVISYTLGTLDDWVHSVPPYLYRIPFQGKNTEWRPFLFRSSGTQQSKLGLQAAYYWSHQVEACCVSHYQALSDWKRKIKEDCIDSFHQRMWPSPAACVQLLIPKFVCVTSKFLRPPRHTTLSLIY